MRLKILSRASDLARLQAAMVADAIRRAWPDVDISLMTRQSAGDLDAVTPLASFADKGAFTADLSDALEAGSADMVVHSWKDLPLESPRATVIAATLERADPRDVLLVRSGVVDAGPSTLRVLSSSPRRAWLLERALRPLLPWRIETLEFLPVRGNVPTRLMRLLEGRGDALVVAKAALDRLLSGHTEFAAAGAAVRNAVAQCGWMVLPLREVPGAPAQGALAIEVAASNVALIARLRSISHEPTWDAVERERAFLASHGGGCHDAVAATVLVRPYGVVISAKAKAAGEAADIWTIERTPSPQRTAPANVFPRPDERHRAERCELVATQPGPDAALFVSRAEAVPGAWSIPAGQLVWASGTMTWHRLAERGIWVHGCADGLGEGEAPTIDRLAGRPVRWLRLTHADAARAGDLATYVVTATLPDDLASRTHFFWTSGTEFLRAFDACPVIRERHHASGPGRTATLLRDVVGPSAGVWLTYDHWLRDMCG